MVKFDKLYFFLVFLNNFEISDIFKTILNFIPDFSRVYPDLSRLDLNRPTEKNKKSEKLLLLDPLATPRIKTW